MSGIVSGITGGGAALLPWDMAKTGLIGWNSGAASATTISGDGYVQTTIGSATTDKIIGLSDADIDQNTTSIDYGMWFDGAGAILVTEFGTILGSIGTYAVGDVAAVVRTGTTVTYRKQTGGTGAFSILYTSLVASSGALLVDTSIYTVGGSLLDIRLVSSGTEAVFAWSGVTGVTVAR